MARALAIALVVLLLVVGPGLAHVLTSIRLPTARIGHPVDPASLVDTLLDLSDLLAHYISSK